MVPSRVLLYRIFPSAAILASVMSFGAAQGKNSR